MKLGIDIGRVIIGADRPDGRADTSFIQGSLEDALNTPALAGVFESVPRLVQLFDGRVWLVSKAGGRVQDRTRRWLERHRFFERTGIAPGNLRFCLERSQKAEHCKALGLTHFIDDRLDVLEHLHGLVAHLFLFGPQRRGTRVPAWATHVEDWERAEQRVRDTVVVSV